MQLEDIKECAKIELLHSISVDSIDNQHVEFVVESTSKLVSGNGATISMHYHQPYECSMELSEFLDMVSCVDAYK